MLGTREPEIYGKETLLDIVESISDKAKMLNMKITSYQSNYEGALIDKIQEARTNYDAIIINPWSIYTL